MEGKRTTSPLNRLFRVSAALMLLVTGAIWASAIAMAQDGQPLVSEETLTHVSEHVYALVGFPNIGIVVGSRATLVIDTGLGARNGATIVRVAQKLAKSPNLYLTTTHYHSEHTTGEQAFPANTVLIRPVVQQEEMNRRVGEHIARFRGMSAQNKELLQDVKFRTPDILFDNEVKLDLGGVTARLFWLGAAHTKGDELIFVEEDSVLIPGDIVQKDIFPIMPNANASMKGWLSILDNVEALHPKFIVPDHGAAIVDASQIGTERAYFLALQARALELKKQGVSVDDAGKTITAELKAKNPDWPNPNNVAGEVTRVYEQSQ
jgi:glyoxylase-like metal-dependent hydrolase (beta-lactamase superfamily II)